MCHIVGKEKSRNAPSHEEKEQAIARNRMRTLGRDIIHQAVCGDVVKRLTCTPASFGGVTFKM